LTSKKKSAKQPFDIRHCLAFSHNVKLQESPEDVQNSFAKLAHDFYKPRIIREK